MIVNRCLLYVFVRVELRFPLYLPPTAVLGTAFAIFLICRLSSALYLWPHFLFFAFVDYLRAILVTAFTIFPICRLSLLYTCDCIRTFFHLQIISPTIFVTAFAIFPIYRLSPLQTSDCIRIFSHLQINIYARWSYATSLHLLPYDCVWGCLQAGLSHIWTMNTREACVTRCRLVSATKPTVWATASLGDWRITDAYSE